MRSDAELIFPQAPRPGGKKVASPARRNRHTASRERRRRRPRWAADLCEVRKSVALRKSCPAPASRSDFLCCRPRVSNSALPPGQFSLPAPRFGAFDCDTPWNLVGAVLHAIGPLTGTESGLANESDVGHGQSNAKTAPPAFIVFTGDLTSAYDNDNQLSRAYVEYVESAVYSGFKAYLGGGPDYAAMHTHKNVTYDSKTPLAVKRWYRGACKQPGQFQGWHTTVAIVLSICLVSA
ncbi:hypothetical protein JB92DRAFT_2828467 [Gautieria morchelliformis]|nr:hypothetical protein JB92DRAFT_2828467 [Gautieria morchelliformis]